MAMELGGAAPRQVDFDRFTAKPRGLTPMQRANELILRIGCISEAFSGGTATVSYASTKHALPRAAYETILRDEAHHRRLGGLYFEWALAHIDEDELRRLGQVLLAALRELSPFWKSRAAQAEAPAGWPEEDLIALGWFRPRSGDAGRRCGRAPGSFESRRGAACSFRIAIQSGLRRRPHLPNRDLERSRRVPQRTDSDFRAGMTRPAV
jgi:hypothetical protein